MSNLDDFEAQEASIDAIDANNTMYPNMPVRIYLREAEDLFDWSQRDLAALTAAGLDSKILAEIPERAGALRYVQGQLNSYRFSKEESLMKFSLLAPEAYDLRNRLIHHMLFAYRNNRDLSSRVQKIAEGRGDSDMVLDLSDLSVLGKSNSEPLGAIGLNMRLLDEAATKSDELTSLLGVSQGEKTADREVKILRDKAYTHLKRAVDGVREFGCYIFWRDKARLVGYTSAYLHRKAKAINKHYQSESFADAP